MSEKSKDAEEKPDNPIPEKPAATELSDKALEQVSGGIGGSIPSGGVLGVFPKVEQKVGDKWHSAGNHFVKLT